MRLDKCFTTDLYNSSADLKNKIMIQKLKQFFCKHEYRILKKHDDKEERDRLINDLKDGEMIAFSRLHRCKKCGKEQMIGSGIMC